MMNDLKINNVTNTIINSEARINYKDRRLTFRDILRYFSNPTKANELNMPLVTTSSVNGQSIEFCPVVGIIKDSNNRVGIVIDKIIKEE